MHRSSHAAANYLTVTGSRYRQDVFTNVSEERVIMSRRDAPSPPPRTNVTRQTKQANTARIITCSLSYGCLGITSFPCDTYRSRTVTGNNPPRSTSTKLRDCVHRQIAFPSRTRRVRNDDRMIRELSSLRLFVFRLLLVRAAHEERRSTRNEERESAEKRGETGRDVTRAKA